MVRLTQSTKDGIVGNNNGVENFPLYSLYDETHLDHGLIEQCFNKLCDYEEAEEQGLLLRLPCRLGDIIDRIISHNETVTLMFETEVSSFRGLQHFWHGAAWNIPKEYLELPFVKIHGVVPDKITEADTIWIEVRKAAEQALARMEGENE